MSQTVVITGASAGIGRATAHRFARAGARVGLIARDRSALDDVKAEVEALGGTGAVAAVDVADAAAVMAAMEEFALALGPIDIWINNAMVTVFSPVEDMTPEEFRRVTEVTYLGCVHGTWAALQHMRQHGRGLIIQVGSALAYRGIPLQSAYCGAKFAIRGFTDALHSELIHQKSRIKLMTIQLPAVNTPQFDWARTHMPRAPRPVPPVLQPEVIAEAIYKASRKPKREYWIGRSTLEVILANMALPGFLDRLLAYKAYTGQMTRWPARSWRRDNLNAPIHALHRTHGSFDREAGREALLVGGEVARLGSGLATIAVTYCAFALARRVLLPGSRKARRLK